MLVVVLTMAGTGIPLSAAAQQAMNPDLARDINKEVLHLMDKGNIPGLSLVVINNGKQTITNFGYSDIEKKQPVTSHTLFEIGSCSKAFTAMAVMKLAKAGLIDLNAAVTDYLPWFRVSFKNKPVKITILQLLHHTSGMPWQTIADIPPRSDRDALEQTIRKVSGVRLHHLPGKVFEYATINYDILALIIEQRVKLPFEEYLQENILDSLGLYNTSIGSPVNKELMSVGYKIGFFRARAYKAPVYKGNNAAGYIISDAEDIASWLRLQMGADSSALYDLVQATHRRDEKVALHNMSSYAMGWHISLSGNGQIYHDGLNPNYTAYIAFRPENRIGIAILANSNSSFTPLMGEKIMRLLTGEEEEKDKDWDPGDRNDSAFSVLSFMLGGCLAGVVFFLVKVISDIIKRKRKYEPLPGSKMKKVILTTAIIIPFLYGIYLLPEALAGFTWAAIAVWTPVSFTVLAVLILLVVCVAYITFFISLLFPHSNKFWQAAPYIIVISILSGVFNMIVIMLVTSALNTDIATRYLFFYYLLSVIIYLLGRRFVQIRLINLTSELIYDLRMKLLDKVFATSYRNFEKMDSGRVYTALNDDVDTIGESANMLVGLITSTFTVTAAFLYMMSIAFWAALLVFLLITAIAVTYFFVSKSAGVYFENARDTQTMFMQLINGLISGFKEISMHRKKKEAYKGDVAQVAGEYKKNTAVANICFVNAFMIGESLLVFLLGGVVFAIPEIFPDIQNNTIMSFVIVLLYLIGPVNSILNAVPAIMRVRVAWGRVQQFFKEIPAGRDVETSIGKIAEPVESIRAVGITFRYENNGEQEPFTVGPIDLEAKKGEVIFIIGGNGSGKTTFAKLLTGLYEVDEGKLMINNKVVKGAQLSEYYSTVFSNAHLFRKVYNIDVKQKREEIIKYLRILNLEEKVSITGDSYSTIDLSAGQRKRLALLQCYLENAPIYLFDEWAADQDPDYRNIFYRVLLPEMKKAGKIVIAITHDDHYFDVADKIFKMNYGRFEAYTGNYSLTT